MATIPLSIAKYIRSMWMADMIMTYLQVDKQGYLIGWGGYPQHYGLSNLITGQLVTEQVGFLEGLLSVSHTQVLQFVRVGGGRCAHVHLLPVDSGTYVLMFDATVEHDHQQRMQQQVNELSLLTYRQSQLLQELELASQQLANEKRELEQGTELKNRFIATLSHELRTSLTSIVGYTQLLDQAKSADVREANYLSSVKDNAGHLLSLIDNVLEQAKLEAGKVVVQPTNCDVKKIIADLKPLFLSAAQLKGLVFETDIEANLPAQLMLDEWRFRQVLINLVTNALKFTEQGFVRIRLGWQQGHLEFAVTDSGPGIKNNSEIFTAYQHQSTTHALSGAGLGLAITRQLVSAMGGEITVESSMGQGAVFKGFVVAPLPTPAASKNRPKIAETNAKRILVVDDRSDLRNLISIYLEEGGYMVDTASDGAEAVILALQTEPDLVIMDMQMPVTSGYEAVQQLRSDNFTKPIIALSASTVAQDKNYALEVGCNHYLVKPVIPSVLLGIVEQFML